MIFPLTIIIPCFSKLISLYCWKNLVYSGTVIKKINFSKLPHLFIWFQLNFFFENSSKISTAQRQNFFSKKSKLSQKFASYHLYSKMSVHSGESWNHSEQFQRYISYNFLGKNCNSVFSIQCQQQIRTAKNRTRLKKGWSIKMYQSSFK